MMLGFWHMFGRSEANPIFSDNRIQMAAGIPNPPPAKQWYCQGRAIARLLLLIFAVIALPATSNADVKIEGPNACVECHKEEGELWKNTHHFTTFRSMPRTKEARSISKKLGIRRLKAESLCLNCHFTTQTKRGKKRVVSGISCESCHGKGKPYIELHSGFSGKKDEKLETKAEEKIRWAKADKAGMIRPNALYAVAKNCFGCHLVPQEKLVNVGGHPPGSEFDLVAWSQGEVRHNVWYSKGKSNKVAAAGRRRMLYLVGLGVELENSLRAVGFATKRKTFAFKMARRVAQTRQKIAILARALPNVPELAQMVKHGKSAWLTLNNKKALHAAAKNVAQETINLSNRYNGQTFAAIDQFLPQSKDFRGKPKK